MDIHTLSAQHPIYSRMQKSFKKIQKKTAISRIITFYYHASQRAGTIVVRAGTVAQLLLYDSEDGYFTVTIIYIDLLERHLW